MGNTENNVRDVWEMKRLTFVFGRGEERKER